ncbi:hypothetical protein [Catellatospora methionotrophica]|nr:hypothetical protein [Catellatospora methionotrophica]
MQRQRLPRPSWADERARELTPADLVARDFSQLVAWNRSTSVVRAVLARLRTDLGGET